jgi:hypothetical protein
MLTDADAAEALSAVAEHINCDEGEIEVLAGHPRYRLVLLGCMESQSAYDPYCYVYSLETKRVYNVRSELEPDAAFEIIANRDNG